MTDDTLFTQDQENEEIELDENRDYHSELVGEGKKFKDNKDLAKGKYNSDLFIKRLEKEAQELRQELKSRSTLDDVVKQLKTTVPPSNLNNQKDERNTDTEKNKEPNDLDIDAILERKLSEREQTKLKNDNVNFIKQELTKLYGTNFASKLKQETETLGLDEGSVDELARNKPKVLLALLGVKENKSNKDDSLFAPPNSSITLERTLKGNSGEKTNSYYEKIRKDTPDLYFSARIQNEIFESVKKLGRDKFYS